MQTALLPTPQRLLHELCQLCRVGPICLPAESLVILAGLHCITHFERPVFSQVELLLESMGLLHGLLVIKLEGCRCVTNILEPPLVSDGEQERPCQLRALVQRKPFVFCPTD